VSAALRPRESADTGYPEYGAVQARR